MTSSDLIYEFLTSLGYKNLGQLDQLPSNHPKSFRQFRSLLTVYKSYNYCMTFAIYPNSISLLSSAIMTTLELSDPEFFDKFKTIIAED